MRSHNACCCWNELALLVPMSLASRPSWHSQHAMPSGGRRGQSMRREMRLTNKERPIYLLALGSEPFVADSRQCRHLKPNIETQIETWTIWFARVHTSIGSL